MTDQYPENYVMYGHDTERWDGWKPGDPNPLEIDAAKIIIRAMRHQMMLLETRQRPVQFCILPIFDEVTLEEVA